MAERTGKQARPKAVAVDGLLLLNKPAGLTSNQALQMVKRLLRARKAGHTGSLDPAATGMLPLCFGEATKVCAYLLQADKTYRVTAKLGEATDTGDAEGTINATAAVPDLGVQDWEKIIAGLTGNILQVPPMYSALKKDGKRLYELARQGRVVEREPRPITIHDISLLELKGTRLALAVHCSKGTYIRTLVEDIAKAAGTVAHTVRLHRETVGDFRAADMLDMDSAQQLAENGPEALRGCLQPADVALAGWSECQVGAVAGEKFSGGQAVHTDIEGAAILVRVYGENHRFLGVGELTGEGTVAPRRIFRLAG